jgi:hypothetical protein
MHPSMATRGCSSILYVSPSDVGKYLTTSGLFMTYLTTLSVAQSAYSQILGWLVNIKLENIWKEAIVA